MCDDPHGLHDIADVTHDTFIERVLTCTMLYAAIAPQAALRSTFGESLDGPVAEIVVRNWGALIAVFTGYLIGVRRRQAAA